MPSRKYVPKRKLRKTKGRKTRRRYRKRGGGLFSNHDEQYNTCKQKCESEEKGRKGQSDKPPAKSMFAFDMFGSKPKQEQMSEQSAAENPMPEQPMPEQPMPEQPAAEQKGGKRRRRKTSKKARKTNKKKRKVKFSKKMKQLMNASQDAISASDVALRGAKGGAGCVGYAFQPAIVTPPNSALANPAPIARYVSK